MLSTLISSAKDIPEKLVQDVEVVGIDEAQWLDPEIVPVVKSLAGAGLRVIVAGLDQDYSGAPFGSMPQLLAEAEYITTELAICVVCGQPAGRSQRLVEVHDQIHVGEADAYEPRCRKCFSPEPATRTNPPQQELLPFLR
jgi:thymidine kinase